MSADDAAFSAAITTEPNASSNSSSPVRPRRCYSWLLLDCTGTCRCVPSFLAVDRIYKTDGSFEIKIIDVAASFSPPAGMLTKAAEASPAIRIVTKLAVILWKLIVIGVEWYGITIEYFLTQNHFYFAYLTSWSLFFAMVYSLFSLMNTLLPISNKEELKKTSVNEGLVSLRVRLTWFFFTMAAFLQMIVTVLFWVLVYDGTPTLYELLAHGIIFVLVWVDGLMINRIPVRMRHWFEMGLPFLVLWTVWSVLHGRIFEIPNPDPNTDLIYAVLDWAGKPWFCLGLVSGLVLIFSPLVHLFLVGLSLVGRQYVDDSAIMEAVDAADSANPGGDDEDPVPVSIGGDGDE